MGCGASKAPLNRGDPPPAAPPAEPVPAVKPAASPSVEPAVGTPAAAVAEAAKPAAAAVAQPVSATPAPEAARTPTPARGSAAAGLQVVFVIGNEATERQKLCQALSKQLGCTYLNPSELLKEEVKSESELGQNLAMMIKQVGVD